MTVAGGPPAPARADRLRVALLTREYPPEVYGGAGVHVTYLARELAGLVDLTVHCQGGDRPGAVAHQPWDLLAGANQALATISTDLSMTAAVGGADLVHSHTWYANLAGHLASMLYGIPHVMTCTRWSRCARGRRSSLAADTPCPAGVSGWRSSPRPR